MCIYPHELLEIITVDSLILLSLLLWEVSLYTNTVLSRFLAHVPLSEHAPLLKYRHTEVNCNTSNIGAPAFSINSQNVVFRL